MLLMISLIIVFGYSLYFYISSVLKESSTSSSLSKCIPMALGMTSSVTIGLVIGIWIPEKLAIATILSIIISTCSAFFIGRRFGVSGLIESQAASLMGAMMGAMLGVMLSPDETTLMVVAMDFIFLFSIFAMLLLLPTKNKESFFKKMPVSFYVLLLLGIGVISSTGILEMNANDNEREEIIIQHHHEH